MNEVRDMIDERVAKLPDAPGCWLWTRHCDKDGYGRLRLHGLDQRAHRVSYAVFVGPVPQGMFVCHKCDTTSCVRPDHLFLGTPQDNMTDKRAKGRAPRGESAGVARLTEADIRVIRRSPGSQESLGRIFGVSQVHIGKIKRREAWAHVSDDASPGEF